MLFEKKKIMIFVDLNEVKESTFQMVVNIYSIPHSHTSDTMGFHLSHGVSHNGEFFSL